MAQAFFTGAFTPAITQVMLNGYSLSMSTGDAGTLSATVLYSDNTEDSNLLWVSSNKAVVQVNENGRLTDLAAGNVPITTQAAIRKSTKSAEYVVTIVDPLRGYSISVQHTSVESYVYIYVQPEDDNITYSNPIK